MKKYGKLIVAVSVILVIVGISAIASNQRIHSEVLKADLPSVKSLIKGKKCEKLLKITFADWRSLGEWTRQPLFEPNSFSFNTPTETVGNWLKLDITPEFYTVTKLTHDVMIEKKISRYSCKVSSRVNVRNVDPDVIEKNFNDHTLQTLLKEEKTGVILVWSPYMPLSIDSIYQLRQAAKKFDIKVTAVMGGMPTKSHLETYEDKFAEKEIQEKDFKTMESLDLLMRGAALHYPSLLVFKNGKLIRRPHYGAETKDVFERVLAKYLVK